MEQASQQINIDSLPSFKNFMDTQWSCIQCPIRKHQNLLSKICIDPRCDKNTEQFHLVCDKCIAEQNTHQGGKNQHQTIDLYQYLMNQLNFAFGVEVRIGSNQLQELKSKSTSIQTEPNQKSLTIKQLVLQILKQDNIQQQQEKINELKQFSQFNQANLAELIKSNKNDKEQIQNLSSNHQDSPKRRTQQIYIYEESWIKFVILGIVISIIILYISKNVSQFSDQRNQIPIYHSQLEMKIEFFQIIDSLLKEKLDFDSNYELNVTKSYYWKHLNMSIQQYQSQSDLSEQSYDKSINRLKNLSNNKFYPASTLLGQLYLYGIYLKEGSFKGFKFFKLANKQAGKEGCAVAILYIGLCYQYGFGIEKNEEEGFNWRKKSADLGFSIAQANVGYGYEHGIGTNKNFDQAFKYYQLSADQNNPYGLNNLGYSYEMGHGVKQDDTKAFHYHKLAADQGLDVAQYNVGIFFQNGIGCQKDIDQSKIYLQKAANQRYQKAIDELKK